jgi:hypothetical protein
MVLLRDANGLPTPCANRHDAILLLGASVSGGVSGDLIRDQVLFRDDEYRNLLNDQQIKVNQLVN